MSASLPAENSLHPLQIADARQSAYDASEKQREVEQELVAKGRALAEAERDYRRELTTRILRLHMGENGQPGLAITTCEVVAKGEPACSELRFKRDLAKANLDSVRQQAFRRGADRKTIDGLLEWSMKVQLRTDTPPPGFTNPPQEPPS